MGVPRNAYSQRPGFGERHGGAAKGTFGCHTTDMPVAPSAARTVVRSVWTVTEGKAPRQQVERQAKLLFKHRGHLHHSQRLHDELCHFIGELKVNRAYRSCS